MIWKWLRVIPQLLPMLLLQYLFYRHRSRHPERHEPKDDFAYFKPLTEKFARRLRCSYIIQGKENLPEGQGFFVANHVSLIDPIIVYAVSDRPLAFVAKKQIRKIPLFGKACLAMKCEFLDREDLRSEIKTFHAVDEKLAQYPELSYFVFPEGTRSVGPEFPLAKFHAGTFKIAVRRALPIVPMAMWLSERCLDHRYHYHHYPIQITYLKPILPETYQTMTNAEIAALAQSEIDEELKRMKEKDRELVKSLNHYSDKKTDKVLFHHHYKSKG